VRAMTRKTRRRIKPAPAIPPRRSPRLNLAAVAPAAKAAVRCPHGKQKRFCATCTPCPHGKVKHNCVACNPCPHGKLKQNCKTCTPCPHGKLRRNCVRCTPCPHGKLKRNCTACEAMIDRVARMTTR